MAKKGIDGTFLHYGVRKEDMALIEKSCQDTDFELNPEWMKEHILRPYNEGGNEEGIVEEKTIRQILKNALKKL